MADGKINHASSPGSGHLTSKDVDAKPESVSHHENVVLPSFGGALSRDLDVAMTLFDHPEQIHEPRDPEEERKLVRKIDYMILPYLAVCYAFFYIDKTTLSYAGMKHHHKTYLFN
jgi:hypothetical protein